MSRRAAKFHVIPAALLLLTFAGCNAIPAQSPSVEQRKVGQFAYVRSDSGTEIVGFETQDGSAFAPDTPGSPFQPDQPPNFYVRAIVSDREHGFVVALSNGGDGATPSWTSILSLFRIDSSTGTLTQMASADTGTRCWSLEIDSSSTLALLLCGSTVHSYRIDAARGSLSTVAPALSLDQTVPTWQMRSNPVLPYVYAIGDDSSIEGGTYHVHGVLRVFRVDAESGALTPVPGAYDASREFPPYFGGAFDRLGRFYFANSGTDVSVFALSQDGTVREVQGSPFVLAHRALGYTALTGATTDTLYFSDTACSPQVQVYRYDAAGALSSLSGPAFPCFPHDMTLQTRTESDLVATDGWGSIYLFHLDSSGAIIDYSVRSTP